MIAPMTMTDTPAVSTAVPTNEKSSFLRSAAVTIKTTLLFEWTISCRAEASSPNRPCAGACLKAARRFCWSVAAIPKQSSGMEPENLDIEQINADRREAIQKNIEVVGIDDLKALGEQLFHYQDHPWRDKFFEFIEQHSSDTCYHATTNDGIEVLYCPATEKGMWYTQARGMGPLSVKALAAMKEIVSK
jgi:hypothetical protein